jgi:chromosome segregation ATPase
MFLDEELEVLHKSRADVQAYNLEKEFSETSKHKSPLAMILLGICFLVVLSTVVVMSLVIDQKDKGISVEMSVFDDLNLKNLLDTVSKIQDNYDSAVKSRSDLINDREVELRNAESKLSQDTYLIKSLKLSASEETIRIAEAKNTYDDSVKAINNKYEPKIKALETEIEGYENQLKEYDASKVQAAQEQERLINSERRVQELERRKLAQQYEDRIAELEQTIEMLRSSSSEDVYRSVSTLSSKYQAEINGLDPKLHDIKAEDLIAEARVNNPGKFDSSKKASGVSGETAVNGLKKFQNEYDNYNYLVNAVAALPQKNSIPSYVAASRAYVNSMGETFTETAIALESEKKKLSKQVANLSYEVKGWEKDYDDLIDEYNELVDEYDELNDSFEGEKKQMKVQFEAEKQELLQKSETEKEQLKTEMLNDFSKESDKQKQFYENLVSGVITNSKAMAAVVSASSQSDIQVYVTPEIKKLIGTAEIPAEIKAAKAVKGTIKADGEYFKFIPAKDKNGAIIDFDLATVTPGVIVKLTVKK